MAAIPTDFLTRVAAETAALKGIKDSKGVVKENDATIVACAGVAYTQVCRACRRPFHYGERTIVFDDYFGPLPLLVTPVDRTKPITVTIDDPEDSGSRIEVPTADWRISKNQLILYNYTAVDTGVTRFTNVEVTLTCGSALLENVPTLFTAVQLQTLGNYHRKDALGLSETSGEKGIARQPADSGELLESARQLLDHLIYQGHGYLLDDE